MSQRTPLAAALREAREETGLDVELVEQFAVSVGEHDRYERRQT